MSERSDIYVRVTRVFSYLFSSLSKVCSSLINDKTRSLEMSFSTMPDLRSVRHGCIWWETNCFKE